MCEECHSFPRAASNEWVMIQHGSFGLPVSSNSHLQILNNLVPSDVISYSSFWQKNQQQKPIIFFFCNLHNQDSFLRKFLWWRPLNSAQHPHLQKWTGVCQPHFLSWPHINRKTHVRWRPNKVAKDCAANQGRLYLHSLSVRDGVFSNRLTIISQVTQSPKQANKNHHV